MKWLRRGINIIGNSQNIKTKPIYSPGSFCGVGNDCLRIPPPGGETLDGEEPDMVVDGKFHRNICSCF